MIIMIDPVATLRPHLGLACIGTPLIRFIHMFAEVSTKVPSRLY